MSFLNEDFTTACKNTEVISLSVKFCNITDFYFCRSCLVEFVSFIKLIDQEDLAAIFTHAMACVAVHKETKLVRRALKNLV